MFILSVTWIQGERRSCLNLSSALRLSFNFLLKSFSLFCSSRFEAGSRLRKLRNIHNFLSAESNVESMSFMGCGEELVHWRCTAFSWAVTCKVGLHLHHFIGLNSCV